jgi:hypothetical protein
LGCLGGKPSTWHARKKLYLYLNIKKKSPFEGLTRAIIPLGGSKELPLMLPYEFKLQLFILGVGLNDGCCGF